MDGGYTNVTMIVEVSPLEMLLLGIDPWEQEYDALEAEIYGRHAQWTREEQFSVWDLFGDYVGKHRSERAPMDDWEISMWIAYLSADPVERSLIDHLS